MAKKWSEPPPLEPREVRSPEEIDVAIAKLKRRIKEIEQLDMRAAVLNHTGADDVAQSNLRNTIREIFGENSPEYREHQHIEIYVGGLIMGMGDGEFSRLT